MRDSAVLLLQTGIFGFCASIAWRNWIREGGYPIRSKTWLSLASSTPFPRARQQQHCLLSPRPQAGTKQSDSCEPRPMQLRLRHTPRTLVVCFTRPGRARTARRAREEFFPRAADGDDDGRSVAASRDNRYIDSVDTRTDKCRTTRALIVSLEGPRAFARSKQRGLASRNGRATLAMEPPRVAE